MTHVNPPEERGDEQWGLERFVRAQNAGDTFARIVHELQRSRKTTHWMWFVFPQISGLGRSETARRFAISSLDEARAYVRHPLLGARLVQCASLMLAASVQRAEEVLGEIDAVKLRSSMTLFLRAAPEQPVFELVLERFFGGQPDRATDDRLSATPPISPGPGQAGVER
jgi:uncharacterized protein (DUF1810 family)